jgi:hypothetical protein
VLPARTEVSEWVQFWQTSYNISCLPTIYTKIYFIPTYRVY